MSFNKALMSFKTELDFLLWQRERITLLAKEYSTPPDYSDFVNFRQRVNHMKEEIDYISNLKYEDFCNV